MLILQRKKNESLTIGGNIKITILDTGSDKVKIAIEAPKSISVIRSELIEAAGSNQEAAQVQRQSLSKLTKYIKKTDAGKKEAPVDEA